MAGRAGGVGAALAVAGVLAGCAGGSPARTTPAPSASATRSGPTAAEQRLQRALLSATELPLGFQQQDGRGEVSAIGCAGIDDLYLAPGATRAAVAFGHAITDAFVHETISVQPGAAAANVAAFGRAVTACRAFSGAERVAYRVAALPGIPRYGDATAALRVTAAVREARPVDLVAVRLGETVLILANANSGRVDTELTRTLVRRAVDKYRRAG